MNPRKDALVYLEDIQESIDKIEVYTRRVSKETFLEDSKLQDAIVRRLEIIGEAAKNIPQEIKTKYSDIPWRQISGMRDVLIHEYSGVNLARVWKVIAKNIPELKTKVGKIQRLLS